MTNSADRVAPAPTARTNQPSTRRVALAGAAGSYVEYYDYAVYGSVAMWISPLYFSSQNPTTALLSTLAVFAVAYITRPIGGLVFGHFGDRLGRKNVLVFTVLLMGVASALMGILPTYNAIGVLAPVLLIIFRLAQGISAGGELGGASAYVLEATAQDHRGYACGHIGIGAVGGFAGGALVVGIISALTTDAQMSAWGWRIPFLLALPLALLALYVRRRWHETPEFEALKAEKKVARLPIRDAITDEPLGIIRVIGLNIGFTAFISLAFIFMTIYLPKHLGYNATAAYWLVAIVGTLCVIGMPVAGKLSDRLGRKPVLAAALTAIIVLAYPLFLLMDRNSFAWAAVAFVILIVPFTVLAGVCYVALAETVGTRIRYTGLSLGLNISNILAGGTTPLVAELLITRTNVTGSPAFILMGTSLIAVITVLAMPETARRPLRY